MQGKTNRISFRYVKCSDKPTFAIKIPVLVAFCFYRSITYHKNGVKK